MSGLELLRRIRAEFPDVTVIMITAFGTVETAVEAMKAGAYDYITKPIDYEELALVVERALETASVSSKRSGRCAARSTRSMVSKASSAVRAPAAGAGHGLPGRPGRFHRAHPRRDGHRQGTAGAGHSPEQPPQEPPLRHHQLRRDSQGSAGIGAFRPRERCVHRRHGA